MTHLPKSTSDTEEDKDGFIRFLVFPVGIMSGCLRCRGLWFGTGFVLSRGGNGRRLGGLAAPAEETTGLLTPTPRSHSEGLRSGETGDNGPLSVK